MYRLFRKLVSVPLGSRFRHPCKFLSMHGHLPRLQSPDKFHHRKFSTAPYQSGIRKQIAPEYHDCGRAMLPPSHNAHNILFCSQTESILHILFPTEPFPVTDYNLYARPAIAPSLLKFQREFHPPVGSAAVFSFVLHRS